MEKPNSEAGNGGVKRIPIGFRFRPTDEELVVHYLRRKVYSLPLPAPTLIPELDFFHFNPWDLPGDLKENRYFFSRIERDGMNKWSRNLSCGYWKASGKDKQVVAPGTNIVIASRRSFVFYKGKSTTTHWIMRQFRLVGSIYTPNNLTQKLMMQVGDWVVCRLCQSRRKPKSRMQPANFKKSASSLGIKPIDCENLRMRDKNDLGFSSAQDNSPSSSCLSGITDAISYSHLGLEEATSRHSFS